MTRKTVIITGVYTLTTERLVRDLARYCDNNTRIVVSTWEGSKVELSDVESCDVVFTKDPGPGPPSRKHNGKRYKVQNFNRQLYCIITGLDFIEKTYKPEDRGIVLRIRSDFKCTKDPFSIYYDVPVTDKEISNLSNKIWICNRHPCINGKMSKGWDYGVSDFSCMGRYEDVREWHNIKEESIRISPSVTDCEHQFFVSNVVKVKLMDKDPSLLDEKSQTAKRFIDENVVFYNRHIDLGMLCVKYPNICGLVKSVAPKNLKEKL